MFYTPTGRTVRNFKDVIAAYLIFQRLCFRRKGSRRLWEIQPGGAVTELL